MNDSSDPKDRPTAGDRAGSPRQPEPWHAADEKKPAGGGAPVGTHSFTGGGANVGMPQKPKAEDGPGAERSSPRDEPPGAEEPDPLAEPRANVGEILGRKP